MNGINGSRKAQGKLYREGERKSNLCKQGKRIFTGKSRRRKQLFKKGKRRAVLVKGKGKVIYANEREIPLVQPLRESNVWVVIRDEQDINVPHSRGVDMLHASSVFACADCSRACASTAVSDF